MILHVIQDRLPLQIVLAWAPLLSSTVPVLVPAHHVPPHLPSRIQKRDAIIALPPVTFARWDGDGREGLNAASEHGSTKERQAATESAEIARLRAQNH